ncbi:hypothetical protein COCVIDRAFT_112826 [Bipolaris victoriae FI3]|uniref:C2H2-type domain-containing protein n=1 Tax=Bipolaris victoriae (strain FI3) TaxID=930091 RepID=W7DUT8_BIPV3|nr:hypothetical protein COCVIDRAFT_112826 [Bipolaris victoriae FI3]
MRKHYLRKFDCGVPGCSKDFYRIDKLRDHVRQAHKGNIIEDEGLLKFEGCKKLPDAQNVYYCTAPGCESRKSKLRADLLRHQHTHTAKIDRPYRCSRCEQSFLYPKGLKRHEATHLNSESEDKALIYCEVHSCPYGPDGKGFSRRDILMRHMRHYHPLLVETSKD